MKKKVLSLLALVMCLSLVPSITALAVEEGRTIDEIFDAVGFVADEVTMTHGDAAAILMEVGYDSGDFAPKSTTPLTRGEGCEVIAVLYQLPIGDSSAIEYFYEQGIVTGEIDFETNMVVLNATNIMPRHMFSVLANRLGSNLPAPSAEENIEEDKPVVPVFSDVASDSPYKAAIDWAVEHGITNGTSATTFSPNDTCTTSQILTYLWRSVDSPASSASSADTAVLADSPYYTALCWANEMGLLSSGVSGSTPCTRASTVTYLWKMAGSPEVAVNSAFTDVAADSEYAQAVVWALENGITNGTGATTFSPDSTCTRGQIVTFIYRNMEK